MQSRSEHGVDQMDRNELQKVLSWGLTRMVILPYLWHLLGILKADSEFGDQIDCQSECEQPPHILRNLQIFLGQ